MKKLSFIMAIAAMALASCTNQRPATLDIDNSLTPEEIAEWAYFLTITNTFCTGQSIVVDGGESINSHFVWPE